jgi:hypothetical protein
MKPNQNQMRVGLIGCGFKQGAIGCCEATRMAAGSKNHHCIEMNGAPGACWSYATARSGLLRERHGEACDA